MHSFIRSAQVLLLIFILSFCNLFSQDAGVQIAESTANTFQPIWVKDQIGQIIIQENEPPTDIEKDDFHNYWNKIKSLSTFTSCGLNEPAGRATTIKVVNYKKSLVIYAECKDDDMSKFQPGKDNKDIWKCDSIEILLANKKEFPYTNIQVNAGGYLSALKYLEHPKTVDTHSKAEKVLDENLIEVSKKVESNKWSLVINIPLQKFDLSYKKGLFLNIVRNRSADWSDFAWSDLWHGSTHSPHKFNEVKFTDHYYSTPSIPEPSYLAIGRNLLTLENLTTSDTVSFNGKPQTNLSGNKLAIDIEDKGTGQIEIKYANKSDKITFECEIPKGLYINIHDHMINESSDPIRVLVVVNTVASTESSTTFEIIQKGKIVNSYIINLKTGRHLLLIPNNHLKGEFKISAKLNVELENNKFVEISAFDYATRGLPEKGFDRFRPGLENLSTSSIYRAAIIDAANYYRYYQTGEGWFNEKKGDTYVNGLCYTMALVFKSNWPENPYFNDKRFLEAAISNLEAGLCAENWHSNLESPKNWDIQAYLGCYDLIKEDLDEPDRIYFQTRLKELTSSVYRQYIIPAIDNKTFYSDDVGTSLNHFAFHVCNTYLAGLLFDNKNWIKHGKLLAYKIAKHARDGQYEERVNTPTTYYNWYTVAALGDYYFNSHDDKFLPYLINNSNFLWNTSLSDGCYFNLHDGRTNGYGRNHYGDHISSLTKKGRSLARVKIIELIKKYPVISQSWDSYWIRSTPTARYFIDGEEENFSLDSEYYFGDKKGLLVKKDDFYYGLSAFCLKPVKGNFKLDNQNFLELHHKNAGPILWGHNSQKQPIAGTFQKGEGKDSDYLPVEGKITAHSMGHECMLQFNTYEVKIKIEIINPKNISIQIVLVKNQDNSPVLFNFSPGVTNANDLRYDTGTNMIHFKSVSIETNQLIKIMKDKLIFNPYSAKYDQNIKPIIATTILEEHKPFILDIKIK